MHLSFVFFNLVSVIFLVTSIVLILWSYQHKCIKDIKDDTEVLAKVVEGLDGITSVSLKPQRYAELLVSEQTLMEMKLKLKEETND